jgi:hypothetical protein
MRYHEILRELFDTSSEFEWTSSSSGKWVGEFSVSGYGYRVLFSREEDFTLGVGWDFSFEMDFGSGRGVELSGEDSVGVLGTGNASLVFGSVLRVLGDFIHRVKPEYLAFSAQEESRRKLYRRMVNSLLVKYSDYKRIGDHSDDSLFVVSRNRDHDGVRDLLNI